MKSFLAFLLISVSQYALAVAVTTETAQKSTSYVNASKVKVRLSYMKDLSLCDGESLSIAVNEVNYADESSSNTALAKRIYAIESRNHRSGTLGCELTGRRLKKVTSEWVTLDLSQGRHVNMIQVYHDAGQKLEVREIR